MFSTQSYRALPGLRALIPCLVLALSLLPGIATAAPGDLDPSFDGNGLLSSKFGNSEAGALTVFQQADGKLVLAGWGSDRNGFMVVRVAADGTPDSSFSSDGVASVAFSEFSAMPLAGLQQKDGKLVLAGRCDCAIERGEDIALARFNSDGTLDASFGNGGKVSLDIGGSHDLARGVIQQPDGKLVIAGGSVTGQRYRGVFARFNVNGALDTSFGTGGMTFVDFGGNSGFGFVFDDVAQELDGKLVAVGGVNDEPDQYDVGIARVSASGALDSSFDGDGVLRVDVNGNIDQAFAVAIQTDEAIVVAGSTVASAAESSSRALLLRVKGDGSLDNRFGAGGKAVVDLGNDAYLSAIVAQADGRLVATGSRSRDVSGPNMMLAARGQDMILARFNSDGTLDASFGLEGVATADFGSGRTAPESFGVDLVRQTDGKYVAVGPNSDFSFGAARFDENAQFPGLIGLIATSQNVSE